MATDQPTMPVNGNYAPHQGAAEHNYIAHSANNSTSGYSAGPPASTSGGAAASATTPDIPKDEVGWYFVEQYYTTLSRNPEKLFLFYNKRSQFVSGVEEDKVSVCIGQKSINERIKELDWEDAKVRVTNVDSQGSDQNIVIQVIGEISNKSAPHRKFAQTFVLAAQTIGYFVLNDIFRFLVEEDEIEGEELPSETGVSQGGLQEPAPTGTQTAAKSSAVPETVTEKKDAEEVDHKLEEVIRKDELPTVEAAPPAAVNGTPVPEAAEVDHAEEAPVAAVSMPAEQSRAEPSEGATKTTPEPEKPKEPAPTPAAPTSRTSPASAATSAAPPKPAVPKTWATLAAAANRSATPNAPTGTPPAASQPKSTPSSQAGASTAPPPASSTPPARQTSPANSQGESGWQTAGADAGKRQSRIPPQSSTPENPGNRAYIKNVYESVDGDALKKVLTKYGELAYFDISRPKNCAFVDFTTAAGFQAAVAANPHQVGNDTIYVEERRIRPVNFQNQRGGMGRGRGNFEGRPGQGRGGFGKDGRGGFVPRGRGNMTPRGGRGASQPA